MLAIECVRTLWLSAVLVQPILFAALFRSGCAREFSVFTAFIGYDAVRWAWMLWVFMNHSPRQYGFWFMLLEPGSAVLLAASGIEVFGRLIGERIPLRAYVVMIAAVILAGLPFPHPQMQSARVPTWQEVLLNKMFTERALLVMFLVLGLISVTAAIRVKMPDWHGVILFLFGFADVSTYASLAAFPQWAKERPVEGPLFVLSAQLTCLLAWLIYLIRRPTCFNES